MDDLLEATISVTEWKSLGLKLKLKKYQLENIDDNNRGKVKDCRREMISQWLDTGNASWCALVRALASPLVGKRGLAMEIAEKHPIRQLNECELQWGATMLFYEVLLCFLTERMVGHF